jgi:WD40 repeat protein
VYGRQVIVSAGYDKTVRVWDLESGDPALGPLTGHHGPVNALAVGERSSRRVIISGDDRAVRLWDIESRTQNTLRIELQRRVLAIAFVANQLVIGTTAELLLLQLP